MHIRTRHNHSPPRHLYELQVKSLTQGRTYPGRQFARATKFYTVVPNICGLSARNLLHVTLLAARILGLLLDFWKMWAP
jgi:hypothetical protein